MTGIGLPVHLDYPMAKWSIKGKALPDTNGPAKPKELAQQFLPVIF
jgi:hypothetical protein